MPISVQLEGKIPSSMNFERFSSSSRTLLEEGKTFVGTVGRHLSCSNSMELPVKNSVILAQHKIMDWSYLRNSTDWKLTVSDKWFRLGGDNWQVCSRLIEGNYPNWKQVMPQEKDYRSSIELAPGDLDQVCTTIASMPGEKQSNKPVGLCLTRNTCSLLAKGDADGASSEVSVPNAKAKGPGVSVFLNRDYITKALGFGLNHIDIIDEKSPVRFRSSEADGRDMIVMPVRAHDSSSAETPSPEPQAAPAQPQPQQERNKQTMKNISNNNGGSSRQPRTDPPPSPLDEAVARINEVKDLLRQAVGGLNETVGSLKQMKAEQKTTERELKQVRSTIQSLQKVKF